VPLYVLAQIVGAAVAAFMVRPIFPAEVVTAAGLGATVPAPGVSFEMVVYIEALLTFLLMVVIWGTAVDARAPKIGGFGIGLAVFVDILLGGPITGASMNPARSLGPALIGGVWDTHAAYWIGPIVGAVAGGLFYKTLLTRE
jgi:glycerol uptake facilitator-like aquaporin